MNIYHALTLFAFLFVGSPLASAQISNGSFEDFTGFTDTAISTELGGAGVDNLGTATSWIFGQGAGIAEGQTTDGIAAAWLSPNTLGGDAVVSQTFSLSNTGTFSLRWDSFAGQVGVESVHRYNVDLSAVGGASIFNADFEEIIFFDELATSNSVPFNATGGLYSLTFTGLGLTGLEYTGIGVSAGDIFIDNVTVAVPEPGSALIATLAGLGLLFRRRR